MESESVQRRMTFEEGVKEMGMLKGERDALARAEQLDQERSHWKRWLEQAEQREATLREAIQFALSALGTGHCKVNTCDGCNAETKMTIESLGIALTATAPDPTPEEPKRDMCFHDPCWCGADKCSECGCIWDNHHAADVTQGDPSSPTGSFLGGCGECGQCDEQLPTPEESDPEKVEG